MNRSLWLLLPFFILFAILPATRAEEAKSVTTEEELLFMEVPVVVTASKKEQPVTEAPAAVTVVTAEDIRQSGALTIPDVLRMVSGVDVMTITVRDQQVGIRGFNGPLNNKVLVMIDGRSVYTDFFGQVYWQRFPIVIEEIERIEVIKSPISTLYGANAFSGVINIITKNPKEIKGTQVNLTAGSRETYIGSLIHAGEWEKFHYKISAGFDRTDEWGNDARAGDIARGNFYLGYDFGPEQSVSLSGGRAHFEDVRLFAVEATGAFEETGDFDYLQTDYRHGGLKLRAFRKLEDYDPVEIRTETPNNIISETYDGDAEYAFAAGENHSFVIGANYRHIAVDQNRFLSSDQSQNLWALFVEGESRVSEKVRLVAGGRYDRHPLVKGRFSPRAALLYTPATGHTARLSVSQAYRNPSLLESYIDFVIPPSSFVPLPIVAKGNAELKPEGTTSYELGYRGRVAKRATLGVNLFYNEYSDLILRTTETIISPDGVPTEIDLGFENGGDAWGFGGELDFDLLVTDWLSLFTNYSYQRITDRDDNPVTRTINETDRVRHDTPENKVNAGMRMKFGNGLSVNLLLHWVDGTERLITDLSGNEFLAETAPYTIVNGRVGCTFWKERAEASFYVFNIFNDSHFEYPAGIDIPGINLPDRSSDPVGRKIAFKVSCRF